MTEFDHFYDGKAITSDLQMVVTPNLYGKRKRPQWGRFVHAGGISDGEKCFRLHRHRSHAGRESYQKTSGMGDVDVRRVERGCALAGLWL